ncbi:GNAT family N-acetyltransferase [Lentibacillus saliphilus]|uniref:GNAT family N-acetyltransferase n=1 Tax=Lentibacillus saliphilus TaxID=2737028 RepID=UPI001C30B377|nr:GNAT family N-acetyltransferase [Lentibacillus saliphilus]
MEIVTLQEADIEAIVSLFYETIHFVNAKDYSQVELNAWAPKTEKVSKIKEWTASLTENISFVANMNDTVVGFCDMTQAGYLDRLYVHKDFQGQGIATALVERLEGEARTLNLTSITTYASITAQPFFKAKGFTMVHAQTVERQGVNLTNYKMIKHI